MAPFQVGLWGPDAPQKWPKSAHSVLMMETRAETKPYSLSLEWNFSTEIAVISGLWTTISALKFNDLTKEQSNTVVKRKQTTNLLLIYVFNQVILLFYNKF